MNGKRIKFKKRIPKYGVEKELEELEKTYNQNEN